MVVMNRQRLLGVTLFCWKKTKSSIDDWARSEKEFSIKENLERLNISCNSIEKVFLTHAHYDHISGIIHFPNAQVYMTSLEYESLYDEKNKHKECLEEVKKILRNRDVILFDEEIIVDDIKLKRRGGHTPGSMSIELDKFLFSGDALFVQDNVKYNIPVGFTQNKEVSDKLLEEYRNFSGKVITSHDIGEVV